ncbi:MAG: hypothetical protein AB7O73_11985 [Bacteroidia bacterium]
MKKLYKQNSFHAIRSEIVKQLINDSKSMDLIKDVLNSNDVQVKKTLIQYTSQINPTLIAEYEKLLSDSSYELIEIALEKLCIQNPFHVSKYIDLTAGIEGTKGRNVKIKNLELAYLFLGNNNETINQLVDFTSNSYEFLTRVNAFAALTRLDYINEKAIENALMAALSNNGRLAGPAKAYIKEFYAKSKHQKLIQLKVIEFARTDYDKKVLYSLLN